MALAFESINPDIIKELKWRSSAAQYPLGVRNADKKLDWLTKVPYSRLVSFAVPKNDKEDYTQLRTLREKNILCGGYLLDSKTSADFPAGTPGAGYGYGGNENEQISNYGQGSYRTGTTSDLASGAVDNKSFSEARKFAPNPGILSLSIANKGSYGSLRSLSFQLKCYDLSQLETLEVLFMTPGIGVLAEWGWSFSGINPPLISNLSESEFRDKEALQQKLTENIIKSHGNHDGCIATITGFNWSIERDGSYSVQVDATSRGDTMLNMPTNRSNAVLVDYIGRLTYDPDVDKIAADQIDGDIQSTAKQKEALGVGGLDKYNVDLRAGQTNRINLLRVPIWEYDFGLEKLQGVREKIVKEIKKAEEEEEEMQNEIEELKRTSEDNISRSNWFKAIFAPGGVLSKTRMNQLEIGGTKNVPSGNYIKLRELSINGEPDRPTSFYDGNGGSNKAPKSGEQIFASIMNYTSPSANNSGIWDMAKWNKNSQKGGHAGFARMWSWNCAKGELGNTSGTWDKDSIATEFDKTTMHDNTIDDSNGIVGKDSEGNRKQFRPCFVSQIYFDGGKCPSLGTIDGITYYTNVFQRDWRDTYWAGNDQSKDTGVHKFLSGDKNYLKSDAHLLYQGKYAKMSNTVGNSQNAFSKVAGKSTPSKKFSGRYASPKDHERLENVLKKPYQGANLYGEAKLPGFAGDNMDKEQDYEVYKAPDGLGTVDENSLHCDADYLNTLTDFSEIEKDASFYKSKIKKGPKESSEESNEDGDFIKPKDVYLRQLPRLPMFAISVYPGDDDIKFGGYDENNIPQASKIKPKGGGSDFYSSYSWYSFVDFQEIDSNGEFVYLKNVRDARDKAEKEFKKALTVYEERKKKATESKKQNKDYLTKLNETVGQYVPIWALEHILNNTVNFNVNGKRLFRFDSGFLPYDETDRPKNVTEEKEKMKILREYRNLFQLIIPTLASPDIEQAVFTEAGWEVFQKFFEVSDPKNTINSLMSDWKYLRSLPVKIANTSFLKSTNPLVCLLPGQEDTVPNAKHYDPWEGADASGDDQYQTDELMELYYNYKKLPLKNLPDPDSWVGLMPSPPGKSPFKEALKKYKGTDGDEAHKDKLMHPQKLWPNPFKEQSYSGDQKADRSGYVSNILVHIDIIKQVLELATLDQQGMGGASGGRERKNAYEFLQQILNEVSAACGSWWEFGLQIDAENDSVCRIVDKRYTKDIGYTEDIIWRFPLYGTDLNISQVSSLNHSRRGNHIIRDFSIQSMIPNAMKSMAMYGTNASFVDQTTVDDNTFQALTSAEQISWADVSLEGIKYESDLAIWNGEEMKSKNAGLSDSSGNLLSLGDLAERNADVFDITGDGTAGEKAAASEAELRNEEDKVPITFEDQKNKFEQALKKIHDNGPKDAGGVHARRAEKCLYAMLNHPFPMTNADLDALLEEAKEEPDQQKRELYVKNKSREILQKDNPNFFNTLIPLACNITLDGISGIKYGNSFTLGGLPKRYEGKTAFQITNVSHTIDTNGWQTTINGTMRPLPEKAINAPDIYIRDFTDISENSFQGETITVIGDRG